MSDSKLDKDYEPVGLLGLQTQWDKWTKLKDAPTPTKDDAEYLVLCLDSDETELAYGIEAAQATAERMIEEYIEYQGDDPLYTEGIQVSIYKLNCDIVVELPKTLSFRKEEHINGIRK